MSRWRQRRQAAQQRYLERAAALAQDFQEEARPLQEREETRHAARVLREVAGVLRHKPLDVDALRGAEASIRKILHGLGTVRAEALTLRERDRIDALGLELEDTLQAAHDAGALDYFGAAPSGASRAMNVRNMARDDSSWEGSALLVVLTAGLGLAHAHDRRS